VSFKVSASIDKATGLFQWIIYASASRQHQALTVVAGHQSIIRGLTKTQIISKTSAMVMAMALVLQRAAVLDRKDN